MRTRVFLLLVLCVAFACADRTLPPCDAPVTITSRSAGKSACLSQVCREAFSFNIIHINDVYEAQSIGGVGGLAKIATLKKQLSAQAPTLLALAGDFFSPSPFTRALDQNGVQFDGANMVDILNMIPLDIATFGNHELDVSASSFTQRMTESKFTYGYVSTNANNYNYPNLQKSTSFTIGPNGEYKVGVIAATTNTNNKPAIETFTQIDAAYPTLKAEVAALNNANCDIIIALTHLDYNVDQDLARNVSGLGIIIGGHDHIAMHITDPIDIFRSDANDRNVWVHTFHVKTDGSHTLSSRLVPIDASIPDDPVVKAKVDYWFSLGAQGLLSSGIDMYANIGRLNETLDCRTSVVRFTSNLMTDVVAASYIRAYNLLVATGKAPASTIDFAFLNGGSLRADDIYPPGVVLSQYDALRISPFADFVYLLRVRGDLLLDNLKVSRNAGSGQFMQYGPVGAVTIPTVANSNGWLINGQPVVSTQYYNVLTNDFIAVNTGSSPLTLATNLPPVKNDPTRASIIYAGSSAAIEGDIRLALVREFQFRYGANA